MLHVEAELAQLVAPQTELLRHGARRHGLEPRRYLRHVVSLPVLRVHDHTLALGIRGESVTHCGWKKSEPQQGGKGFRLITLLRRHQFRVISSVLPCLSALYMCTPNTSQPTQLEFVTRIWRRQETGKQFADGKCLFFLVVELASCSGH